MDSRPPRGDKQSSVKDAAAWPGPHAPFGGMPNELLAVVFAEFCNHCKGTTLRGDSVEVYTATQSNLEALTSVAKTCSAMRQLTQCVLHHGFPAALYVKKDGSFRFYQFVRTIAMRCDLAEAVRFLALDTFVHRLTTCAPRTTREILPNEEETTRITQMATRYDLSAPSNWVGAMSVNPGNLQPADGVTFMQVREPTAVFIAQVAISLCDKVKVVEFTRVRGECHPYMFSQMIEPLYRTSALRNARQAAGVGRSGKDLIRSRDI